MESDRVGKSSAEQRKNYWESTMLPRVDDVEVALAQAITIQHTTENNTDDEVEAKEQDRDNWCKNPFCQKALQNFYASYCEERTCQQYRALRLQCVANAESAIIREMNSLGRSDSFLVVETRQTLTGTDVSEANKPFVIPRRKRLRSNSIAEATLNNEPRSSHDSTPPREMAARFRRAGNVEIPVSSSLKRPCLGSRMHFGEVPTRFEPPQARRVPALAVSSQMKARRMQQALRWTQARRQVRKSSVEPSFFRDTSQANVLAGGGRYVLSGNRPSTQHSMRGLPLISRPSYKPPPTTCTQTPRTSVTSKTNSGIERTATRESPALLSHPGDLLKKDRPHSSLGEQSRKYRRSESEHTSEVVDYHRSHSSPSQTCSNGYSDHRSYREKTNAAPLSMNWGRKEDRRYTEPYRNPYEDDERYPVRRSLYDDVGNRVNYRSIHETVNTVDRSYVNYPAARQDENRWSTSLCSTFRPFPSGIRTSGDTHDSNTDDNCVDFSVDQPECRLQNLPARVPVERSPEIVSGVISPARFTPENEAAGTEHTISSDTDADCEPTFSFHDPFLHFLLSKFIQKLPSELKPVMNVTKKPRKMKWYIEYTKKIERACKPHVRIQMKSKHVVVMVENRVWLKLKGPSTVALCQSVIKMMRDEAISWRNFKVEVEQSLDRYRTRLGNDADLSYVFLRAWNNLKDRPGDISLPRGSNYFRGTRRYHWSFTLGQVEIGSGRHEDKRKAFSLAAASAAEFLLRLDDGQNDTRWRPPPRDFNSSEYSDDCEFLCVRGVDDEPMASAATAAAITLISASSDSNTSPVIIPPSQQSDNDRAQVNISGQVDEAMIIVISSDTEDEDIDAATIDTASSVQPSSTSSPVDASGEWTTANTETTATQQCNMCEIIRMRKPESIGCRQCQLANKQTRTSTDAKEVTNTHGDAITLDSSTVTKTTQMVHSDSETETASRPTKRLGRIFEMFRTPDSPS